MAYYLGPERLNDMWLPLLDRYRQYDFTYDDAIKLLLAPGHASQEVLLRAPLVALRALSVLPYCACVLHRHKKALADVHLPGLCRHGSSVCQGARLQFTKDDV